MYYSLIIWFFLSPACHWQQWRQTRDGCMHLNICRGIYIYILNAGFNFFNLSQWYSPRLCNSSRVNWPVSWAAVGVGCSARWAGAAALLGYHAQLLDCPLNILNLSYTDSFCAETCCSFCDAKLRRTRLIDDTCVCVSTDKERIMRLIKYGLLLSCRSGNNWIKLNMIRKKTVQNIK